MISKAVKLLNGLIVGWWMNYELKITTEDTEKAQRFTEKIRYSIILFKSSGFWRQSQTRRITISLGFIW